MRHLRLLTLLCLTSVPVFAAACSAPSAANESTDESTSDLVQFPAAAFAAAPVLTYGATSAPIAYTPGGWGVIQWSGTAGDEFIATVTATTADRTPRAYLVEQNADGKYAAILSGTSSVDGLVRAKLAKTQQYFIVFREYSRRVATFTVKLEQAGSLPAACSGTPLLEQGIIDRTPQAETPALNATGVYETSVRRCNVATGCADPVKQSNPAAAMSMNKRASDGKWVIGSPFTAEHDGTTGMLTGTANVTADDGRSIPVALTGAATTGCVSVSGGGRSTIDPITYYDVQVTYRATTPPVAARTPQPATPPPTECDPEALITDEDLLSRFPRGTASVVLGSANINEDQQYCHPQTGCRPWTRSVASINGGARYVQATAVVLDASSLGVKFYNSYNGNIAATMAVQDGTLNVTSDLLIRGNVANTSTVSDAHLQIKETNVFVSGDYKMRRYVCIPIPPHP